MRETASLFAIRLARPSVPTIAQGLQGGHDRAASVLARPWAGERVPTDYRAAISATDDYARAFALADARLRELAAGEVRQRWVRRAGGAALFLGSTALVVVGEIVANNPTDRFGVVVAGGLGGLFGALGFASSYWVESPVERLTSVWHHDPGLMRIQPSIAPVRGGATLGVSGAF